MRQVGFLREKHGRELLVEAAWLSEMPAFDASSHPHALSFYDILLVTSGEGSFALDDTVHEVRPGVVFFTRPGEVRRWRVKSLDGACVFFTGEFVREVFSDARFLDQFSFFRPGGAGGALTLDPAQQAIFLGCFDQMRGEFDNLRGDAAHFLRAKLYELMVLLNRWLGRDAASVVSADSAIDRLLVLVERDFARRRSLDDYAADLAMTPGHLSMLCRRRLGRSAGALIRERSVLEAKRMLLFTDRPTSAIAYALGFEDPSYFSRFFRRETGSAPGRFRAVSREPEK